MKAKKPVFFMTEDERIQDIMGVLFPESIVKEEDIDSTFDYSKVEDSGSIKTMGYYK